MTVLDALETLTADPDAAAAWTSWLASGDASGLPEDLRDLRLEVINHGRRDVNVELERVVLRRRFNHPDGSRWDHVVAGGHDVVVYVQRLHRQAGDRGTVAVIRDGAAAVWIADPDGAPAPDGVAELYALIDSAE